jgi:hypothetical protein
MEIGMMPAEIAKAIMQVKAQVKQLGADERNEHARYNYVSVDKFYAIIGPLMAEAGLALLINEAESEVRPSDKGTPWLFARYELTFLHESGAMSVLPMSRSLAMPINGPQTYGAAQSYIEKQFLRQVFKVPTGEKDADETEQGQYAPTARPQERAQTNGATRTAAAPPPPQRPAHINGAALPPNPEEDPATTAARQRVRMLIDRYDQRIKTAPHKHALELTMDDGRDDLAEIEAAGEKGMEAARALRDRAMTRLAEFDEKAA